MSDFKDKISLYQKTACVLLKEVAIITDEKRGHGFEVEQMHKKVLRERREDRHIVIRI